MSRRLISEIRAQSQPLSPQPTALSPQLTMLKGVKAVLFDIYGTLIISASGDIGLDAGAHRNQAVAEVARLFDLELNCAPERVVGLWEEEIRAEHARRRQQGVEYPEVEIREIWQRVLAQVTDGKRPSMDLDAWSLSFELRVNPTWPMPGVEQTLSLIRDAGLIMGIVSNAQFFTPLLFAGLLGQSVDDLGFAQELTYFSYEHRRAKPGTQLYEAVRGELGKFGIAASEALYVGNDMLNDVMPAKQTGFRTALFAGDQRSLRMRSDDPRVHGVKADIVVTELLQLLECLPLHS